MIPRHALSTTRITHYLIWLFSGIATFVAFVPLSPRFPDGGLDASWQFALNQAVAQGLAFGQEVIFSFGPYASVYTRVYHPGTDALMLSGALLFWLNYFPLLLFIARGGDSHWLLLYALFLPVAAYIPDSVFFSLPLLVALATYRITLPPDHPRGLPVAVPPKRHLALIFLPLGLLPLIKGTLLVLAAVIACLCSVMLYRRKQYFLAYSAIGVPLLSAFTLWVIAGQPVSALPHYVLNLLSVISGYTEAMAVSGRPSEIAAYTLTAALLLVYIASSSTDDPRDSRFFLMACYALLVFLALKAGFVRHDGHAIIASSTLAVTTILSATLFSRAPAIALVTLSLVMWAYIDRTYIGSSTRSVHEHVRVMYSNAWYAIRDRLAGGKIILGRYNESIERIRNASPLPRLPGSTDIYAFQQSALLASGNKWAPRPVLQSYSAYSARLARLDEAYLRQPHAPDNIIFRVETIDERFPSMDDGPSWPVLLENYLVQRFAGDFAVLKKRSSVPSHPVLGSVTHQSEHQFGEVVPLPDAGAPVYAEFVLKQTAIGNVLSFLYKPPQLRLSLGLNDGTAKDFRIVSGMAETGFVLSPLIESTRDFVLFAAGGARYLPSRSVKEFKVTSKVEKSIFWQQTYTMRLRPLSVAPPGKDSTLELFDRIADGDRLSSLHKVSVECEGNIDALNGIPAKPPLIHAKALLSVDGWTAIAPRSGIVADQVFVTLTGEDGRKIYVRTRTTPSVDIKQYFGKPNMADAGFTAQIDISTLRGKYLLGLSRIYQQSLQECRQFRLPIEIDG